MSITPPPRARSIPSRSDWTEAAGEGIRVAAIRPGLIDTDIHASGGDPERAHRLSSSVPMKRVGTAEEIANAIVWLMSDDASYVTSAILDVSGGR